METYNDTFESRLLYNQKNLIEDEMYVSSNLYAVKWNYPGSIGETTARVRITIILNDGKTGLIIHGGTIEKWSDKGWQMLDEYFDGYLDFDLEEEAHTYLMKMCHSFLMGIPVASIKGTVPRSSPTPRSPGTPKPNSKTNLKVLDFAKIVEDSKIKNPNKHKNKKPDGDDPDFDWI